MIINGILKQARGDIFKLNMHALNKDFNNCENENQKSFPSCLSKPCNLSKEIQQIYLRVEVWGLSCI